MSADPLGDIRNTRAIRYVMLGGVPREPAKQPQRAGRDSLWRAPTSTPY
ncbi:MAG: hypothetical protein ACREON_08390 [Gemmatimonadaceae bacterium]